MANPTESSPANHLRKISLALVAGCIVLIGLQFWQQQPLIEESAQSTVRSRQLWQNQPNRFPLESLQAGYYTPAALSGLGAFDPGEMSWLGTAYWLQLGRITRAQDQPGYDYFPSARQISFSAAFLLQLAIPFLALWTAWRAAEGGNQKSIYNSWMEAVLPAIEVTAPAVAVSCVVCAVLGRATMSGDGAIRLVLLLGYYLLFALAATTLSWSILRIASNRRLALLGLSLFWLVNLTLARPLTINLASTVFPTPTLDEFAKKVDFESRNGYNGVESKRDRERRFATETLVEFKVKTIAELPVNLSANLLKKEERFQREVFLRQMTDLWNIFQRQEQFEQTLALLFPSVGLQISSAALSGTNFAAERLELQGADEKWDQMVRKVYEEIVVSSGPEGKMIPRGPEYWRQFPDILPQFPAAANSLPDCLIPFAGLALNATFGLGLVYWKSKMPAAPDDDDSSEMEA